MAMCIPKKSRVSIIIPEERTLVIDPELEAMRKRNSQKDLTKITRNLYLSGVFGTEAPDKYDIGYVISLGCRPRYMRSNVYVDIPDTPKANIAQYFEMLLPLIQNNHEKNITTLVHCQMGISRSATIVTAYIMKKWYDELRQKSKSFGVSVGIVLKYMMKGNQDTVARYAEGFVRSKRAFINPNYGFAAQLVSSNHIFK